MESKDHSQASHAADSAPTEPTSPAWVSQSTTEAQAQECEHKMCTVTSL